MARRDAPPALPGVLDRGPDPARELEASVGGPVAGLDEVGRGPLAGPVVAAAVVLGPDHGIEGLNDSKKLTEKRREALVPEIEARALAYGVVALEAERIDALNILHASMEAMRQALELCEARLGRPVAGAIVDGNRPAPLPARVRQRCVVGGDRLSAPVMAASVLAKVHRDRRMVEEAARHPGYGFERHKGYPTPAHRQALAALGPCALHRRSFAPVREALARQQEGP